MAIISKMDVGEGEYYPLGASIKDGGVNFALYSKYADAVELLLFEEPEDLRPADVIPLGFHTRYVWHSFVKGLKAGQLYAYRVKGPYQPQEGLRFNPNCILIDPYAKAITGKFALKSFQYGYDRSSNLGDLSFNKDIAGGVRPKCVVIDDAFSWEKDARPSIPMHKTLIYEVHVKSFTAHPSSKVKHPGTYLGFIEKIPYLKDLGVTSVELMPVHHCQDEAFLLEKGLCNYWGYSTLGFFAPDSRFSTHAYPGCQVIEFKKLVKALHKAGIEVILDVAYNHTCEGNELGPTFSFRGIDNPTYYVLKKEKRYYEDYTGCGNSLNASEPQVIKLITDSLRYWVLEMHVDGFRFDLASVLGRQEGGFKPVSSFFAVIHQDPVLSKVKLIAEPWDMTWDAYEVGNFPVDWAEWNGKYRDCVRKFVKSDPGMIPDMMLRIEGSPDLYGKSGRTPYHSINFITSHDGFTMNDLVSYATKHNGDNLEGSRDGTDYNYSWSWGVEGPTHELEIESLRKRLIRNFFTILFISEGVPMLLGGDEFLRTQQGNNNAYCHDNELNYFDWGLSRKNCDMVDFVRKLIKFRKGHPHFLCRSFFTGTDTDRDRLKDINWLNQDLMPLNAEDYELRTIAFLIGGHELRDNLSQKDIDIMAVLNSHWQEAVFRVPACVKGESRYLVLDTSLPAGFSYHKLKNLETEGVYKIAPRSVAVFLRKLEGR